MFVIIFYLTAYKSLFYLFLSLYYTYTLGDYFNTKHTFHRKVIKLLSFFL